MNKQTADIYIAGSHFKINHPDSEYVKKVAEIVDKRIAGLVAENEGTLLSDNIILVCLDLCDDMLSAQSRSAELLKKNMELLERVNKLEREIEYFKNPKFVIPNPLNKPDAGISEGQLCFPPFEERTLLKPAVNELSVANIRKSAKGKKRPS